MHRCAGERLHGIGARERDGHARECGRCRVQRRPDQADSDADGDGRVHDERRLQQRGDKGLGHDHVHCHCGSGGTLEGAEGWCARVVRGWAGLKKGSAARFRLHPFRPCTGAIVAAKTTATWPTGTVVAGSGADVVITARDSYDNQVTDRSLTRSSRPTFFFHLFHFEWARLCVHAWYMESSWRIPKLHRQHKYGRPVTLGEKSLGRLRLPHARTPYLESV